MVGAHFQPGVRVRSSVATAFVARGMEGVVLGLWLTIPHAYRVRFDGQSLSWLMWEDELECVEAEAVAAVLGAR